MARPKFIPGSTVVFKVKQRSGKQPLAKYLATRLGVVQPWAEDLIRRDHVKLDNIMAENDQLINLSDRPHDIEVFIPHDWPRHMTPKQMDLEFLHNDECLAILNKPPGIVVHPARGHLDNNTLQNGMRHHYRHLLSDPETTIGSPHRLDKDTSGVIVFALRRDVYIDLVSQFTKTKPHKEYLAIVVGKPEFDTLICDRPIGRHPQNKGLGAIVPEVDGGKPSRTDFTVVDRFNGWALLKAVPHTGRPHQIRIHAASLGLPIAGDRDYNPEPGRLGFTRQALHAATLAFTHPATGNVISVDAPLAPDIRDRIAFLKTAMPETRQGTTL